MATFKDYLTKDGRALITKMLAGGCKIRFTKVVFGDGYLPAGTDPRNMTEVISPKYESEAAAGRSGQVVTVSGVFTNQNFTEATYLREKGVYATDGEHEVLMIYANNGEAAEYIEPSDTSLIEKVIRSVFQFRQDDIVNIEVASGIYVTVENYQQDMIILENTITERFEKVTETIKEMQEYECKIAPRYVTDIGVESGHKSVTLRWKDPGETFIDGVKVALWDGTKLVMNEDHYPTGLDDGTLVIDNTEKNKYSEEGLVVSGLTNLKNYYFRFFPYCVCGGANDYSEENKVKAVPGILPVDAVTDISITQNTTSFNIKWTDPEETKMYDTTPATWAKTVLVYKEGSYPESMTDGTAIESTVHDQYKETGLDIAGFEVDKTYYFRFYTITDLNAVNSSELQEASASLSYATLTVNFSDDDLAEGSITVTATFEGESVTGTVGSMGFVQLKIPYIGEVDVVASRGDDEKHTTVTIEDYTSYSILMEFLKIVTWADGTDEEISAMLEAHYADKINISDYWAAGDERVAYTDDGTEVNTIAIVGFDLEELVDPINGHTTAAVTVIEKNSRGSSKIYANIITLTGYGKVWQYTTGKSRVRFATKSGQEALKFNETLLYTIVNGLTNLYTTKFNELIKQVKKYEDNESQRFFIPSSTDLITNYTGIKDGVVLLDSNTIWTSSLGDNMKASYTISNSGTYNTATAFKSAGFVSDYDENGYEIEFPNTVESTTFNLYTPIYGWTSVSNLSDSSDISVSSNVQNTSLPYNIAFCL